MHRDKGRFIEWIRRGFLLRFHMTLMLVGAFIAGLLTTKLLLELNVDVLWLRYLIAVTVAYAVFVGSIRLWLLYVGIHARRRRNESGFDVPADLADALWPDGALTRSAQPALEAAGGRFGGAGATESWGSAHGSVASAPVRSSSGAAGGISFDLDELILVLLVAAAILAIFLSAAWLVWAAPTILAEAAFEAALASALVRRARKIDSAGWVGSVVRATFLPFAITLALSIAAGWYAQKHCPDATKLVDAFSCKEPR